MNQYSACADPTESAARRERVRQAEERGELEEAVVSLAWSTLEVQRLEHPENCSQKTPERLPALQRIGPISEPISALRRLGPLNYDQEPEEVPASEPGPVKRVQSRSTVRRTTPASLNILNAGVRKRRVTKTAPSPRSKVHRIPRAIPRNKENRSKPSSSKTGTRGARNIPRLQRTSKGADFHNPPSPLP